MDTSYASKYKMRHREVQCLHPFDVLLSISSTPLPCASYLLQTQLGKDAGEPLQFGKEEASAKLSQFS